MAALVDFSLARQEDGSLNIAMAPSVNISGWSLQFTLLKSFGGISGIVIGSCASGFNGVSGISVINGLQGNFTCTIGSQFTSGLGWGAYAYDIQRLDSGFRTVLVEGNMLLLPGTAGA